MTKRHVSLVSLSAIGAVLLTQFQNCAPAVPATSADGGANSGTVRVIEDLGSNELAFVTKQVQLRDEAEEATISGLCTRPRTGARLKWQINDEAGRPLATGEGACAGGQFKLELSSLGEMVCGVTNQIVVEGEWGGSAAAPFVRRCQPVMSEAVAATDRPYGTTCELEYQPASVGAGAGCLEVCYREDQVIDVVDVPPARCAPMASRLAGP